MACAKCGAKKQARIESAPEYVTKATGGTQVVVAARSDCRLVTAVRTFFLKAGSTTVLLQPEAADLLRQGAPIWVLA